MTDSILGSVKSMLGLPTEDTGFEPELILHINSVLADLAQLGVGPDEGFVITGSSQIWSDLTDSEKVLNGVQSYVFHRVKMLFDPPQVGYVVTAVEKMIEKAEWRISVAVDELKNPPIVPVVVLVVEE